MNDFTGVGKALLLEAAEALRRKAKRLLPNAHLRSDETIRTLHRDGIVAIPAFMSREACDELRQQIDAALENDNVNVWRDKFGADNRIYEFDRLFPGAHEFFTLPFIRSALYRYMGCRNPVGFLLAGKLDAVSGNTGSGGGWHRDSPVSHQFKALIYLSDVGEDNGPFEYIVGSHTARSSAGAYLKGIFAPNQMRFSERDIDDYVRMSGQQPRRWTGTKGTLLLVDTKGLHRGVPIVSGSRYALTSYFWETSVPQHFSKLLQNPRSYG